MSQNSAEISAGESGRQTELSANHPAKPGGLWTSLLCIWYATVLPAGIFMAPWTGLGSHQAGYKTKTNEGFIIQLSPLLVENFGGGEWLGERKEWCSRQTGPEWQLSGKCNIFPVGCHYVTTTPGEMWWVRGVVGTYHDTINRQQYLQISTPVTARSSGQH